jgi:hypothetical protein
MKTNQTQYLSSIYLVSQPLHVRVCLLSIIRRYSLYIYSNWYVLYVYVDWLLELVPS